MTIARKEIIIAGDDGIYHCIGRCVRRAFLCGFDALSGKNFDHRKSLIQKRIKFLSEVFVLDVLTLAIMSNHFHIILRLISKRYKELSDEDVARRWLKLYPRSKKGKEPTELEITSLTSNKDYIKEIRKRLGSISWFMKSLNEYVARIANKEDNCKGRFWEGRFKAQRIDDEAGLLACSIYVDLNPIRASVAKTPEESEFTGAYERIKRVKNKKSIKNEDSWLPPLEIKNDNNGYLPITEKDYFELLDWTGRQIVEGKRGNIPSNITGILNRLKIKEESWVDTTRHYGKWYGKIVCRYSEMKNTLKRINKSWCKGLTAAKVSFM